MAPPIPLRIKLAVVIAAAPPGAILCAETGEPITAQDALDGLLRFDHRPPYADREINLETLDTIPPANDMNAIQLVKSHGHDLRTFGQGGVGGSTGSDAHRRAKRHRMRENNELHAERMAAKAAGERKPERKGQKIQSRPFATNRDGPLKKPMRGKTERRT